MTTPTQSNLTNLLFHRISSVDNPAMEDAQAVIMKRREPVNKDGQAEILTSVEQGHQHGISIESWDNKIHLYVASGKMAGESDYGHSHSIMVKDGKYMLSMNVGHTHTVDQETLQQAMLTRAGIKKEEGEQAVTDTVTEAETTPTQLALDDGTTTTFSIEDLTKLKDLLAQEKESAEVEKTEAKTEPATQTETTQEQTTMTSTPPTEQKSESIDVTKFEDEITYLKAVISLEKSHRGFFDQLSADEQRTFAKKSMSDRDSQMAASRDLDPVVYTTDQGVEIRKSSGDTVIMLARSNDEARRENRELREARERDVLEKRADDEIGHLSGDLDTRVELLRAIDKIDDETVRTNVLATIKANDAGVSRAFKNYGSLGQSDPRDPEVELDRLAKNLAAEKGITEAQAYVQVAKTDKGRELYARTQIN